MTILHAKSVTRASSIAIGIQEHIRDVDPVLQDPDRLGGRSWSQSSLR